MDDNKIEKILFKILDYQSEHKVDDDSILIMISLLNLMGMVNVLNREGENSAIGAGTTGLENMKALLGPLMALMASGMGKGGTVGEGQSPFNPAALLSILSGVLGGNQGKGGGPDLSALFSLLGPLLGMGGVAQPFNQSGADNGQAEKGQPVQREINLDKKYKTFVEGTVSTGEGTTEQKKERPPKPGEVLKWKFGT